MAEDGYREAIREELAGAGYLTVLPASEGAFLALGPEVPHLTNKASLEAAAWSVGVSVPRSETFADADSLLEHADGLDFPVVVKPAVRTFNAFRADGPSDLRWVPRDATEIVVQPFLNGELGAVSGVMWRGRVVAGVHERWLRIWPAHCGLASAAVTVEPDREVERKLEVLLQGYEGIFCTQWLDGHLLDLNLRVYSTHPLAVKAGVNLLSLYCDLLDGREVPSVRARAGFFYRWLEGDVRNIVRQMRRREMEVATALRALAPKRNAAHSIESLRDPGPVVARLRYALGRAHLPFDARRVAK
jgi:predicted ATP-grasp superfamily ATP-dependent carboligase